jgi:hypothetical protein
LPKFLVFAFLASLAVVGCGPPSADKKFDDAFKYNPEFKKVSVAKLSGHVTIDGQAPSEDLAVFVILNDPQNLKTPGERRVVVPIVKCNAAGEFSFTTYAKGDGAPVGKYVVTITGMKKGEAIKARGGMSDGETIQYRAPDVFKNLFNDPEKNQKDENFVIDLQPPGITKEFALTVAGKDAVAVASKYAPRRLGGDLED